MQIRPIRLNNQQPLINDYRNEHEQIMSFFDYGVSADQMAQRLEDLKTYDFNRQELVTALSELNQTWDAPTSTLKNIERLKQSDSVVVIGGQQVGLLTGPMYTINKIISIIQYAKKQEAELNVPVIPVFWMAGEDHDFDEINHVFAPFQRDMKKITTPQYIHEKKQVSDIPLDQEKTKQWIEQVFSTLEETSFTKKLLKNIRRCLNKSTTFVDFFARCMFDIFTEEGLVLFDSGNAKMRRFESNYFMMQIEQQEQISAGVYGSLQDLKRCGYNVELEADSHNTHLFYHVNHERVLLYRTADGDWIGKNNEVKLTTDQIKDIATHRPQLLSNNVVTRPLMQELMFPTLAFVGGPGEISYWAALKPAFHALNLKMPPVIRRLSLTYVHQHTMKLMEKYSLSLDDAVNEGIEKQKERWLSEKINPPIDETVRTIKRTIHDAHQPLRDMAHDLGADMGALAEKNLTYLYRDLEFLERRMTHKIEEQYSQELLEFDRLNMLLHPEQGLQERVWNPLFFINQYGKEFITNLTTEALSFEEDHFLVIL